MNRKVHWEYRHPNFAIAKFWALWLLAMLLLVPVLALKLVAIIINLVCVWVVSVTEITPWELTQFLRRDLEAMKRKEAAGNAGNE